MSFSRSATHNKAIGMLSPVTVSEHQANHRPGIGMTLKTGAIQLASSQDNGVNPYWGRIRWGWARAASLAVDDRLRAQCVNVAQRNASGQSFTKRLHVRHVHKPLIAVSISTPTNSDPQAINDRWGNGFRCDLANRSLSSTNRVATYLLNASVGPPAAD
jgi:hypothetical protein